MTDTETINIDEYRDGVLVGTRQETRQLSTEEVEQREYTTALAAELESYKADNLALQTALDAAVAAIPNNAFTGASQLKTALREISDQSKAQRRMFRAAIRDVAALDDGQ
jgi:hypothetical protein